MNFNKIVIWVGLQTIWTVMIFISKEQHDKFVNTEIVYCYIFSLIE